ncbi:MAG TPA: PIN domain-containing protein [Acidimicrobiia bacterium]|nr:PIN domain-containing protein [Acidimicrobiia bacterium]
MRTFVDTSALYALLDEDDDNHVAAADWLRGPGREPGEVLVSHNYVVVETAALVHRRLGASAVRVLFDAFVPALSIVFVDEELHGRAVAAYLAALRRRVSYVDWVSFQLIRDSSLDRAFAFDRDFVTAGFAVVP